MMKWNVNGRAAKVLRLVKKATSNLLSCPSALCFAK